jgi:hypothetical protein
MTADRSPQPAARALDHQKTEPLAAVEDDCDLRSDRQQARAVSARPARDHDTAPIQSRIRRAARRPSVSTRNERAT